MHKHKILLIGFFILFTCIERRVDAGSKEQDMPGLSEDQSQLPLSSRFSFHSSQSRKVEFQHFPPEGHKKRKRQVPRKKATQKKPQKQADPPTPLPEKSLITSYFSKQPPAPSMPVASSSLLPIEDTEGDDDDLLSALEELDNLPVSPTHHLTRLRRGMKTTHSLSASSPSLVAEGPETLLFGPCLPYVRTGITPKDDSDTEDDSSALHRVPSVAAIPDFPAPVIRMGTQVKLLANVYLKNLDQTANIFLPYFILRDSTGLLQKEGYFQTPKGEICIFASGGFQNVWESTVASVQRIFFKDRVRIIRASWIQNQLFRRRGIEKDLEEEFRGRENELHSEFYYDLFFEHFFLPSLLEGEGQDSDDSRHLTIYAFSWWDVCTECEQRLTKQHATLPHNIELSYKIAASRRYRHTYPSNTAIQEARIPSEEESVAWDGIWSRVSEYARKEFESPEEMEDFWTSTKDGLELCKWLGQAFEENKSTPAERTAPPSKKGDILRFYHAMTGEETRELEALLFYLREVNWDLSCWYRPPYPSSVQRPWKKYWRQLVMPHFGWEEVKEAKVMEGGATPHCEMCGHEDLHEVFFVFHPKFHVSARFLSLPKEEQAMRERDCGHAKTPTTELPPSLRKKRRDWLKVGSKCVETLELTRGGLKEWEEDNPREERDRKWKERDEREAAYEALEKAEKELKAKEKTHKKSTQTKRRKK